MAYRGGGPMQSVKRTGRGFDNQFTDLTMNPTPPKRPRTAMSHKATGQVKTPLKFNFQAISKKAPLAMHNPIAPKQHLPAGSSRFVSKPLLISQTADPPPATKMSTQDDPWGDDDDEDDQFLLAASQAVEEKTVHKPSEEDIAALTRMCNDDEDFDMDNIDGGDSCDRLNQTVAVFTQVDNTRNNKPFDNSFAEPVFKLPLPKPGLGAAGTSSKEAELLKLKRELEVLRKETQKAKDDSLRTQGEVSYLRTELTKKVGETEAEKCSKIQMEKKARMELEVAEKSRKAALAAIETEKIFMQQEMQGLRDRLRKMEEGCRGERKSTRVREIKKEASERRDNFPSTVDFEVAKVETKESETQTEKVLKRRTKLSVRKPTLNLDVLNFTRLCNVKAGVKAAILQTTTDDGKHREINKGVKSTLRNLEESIRSGKADLESCITTMSHFVSLAPSGVTLAERQSLVNICIDMVRQGKDCAVLGLRLLYVCWDVAKLTVGEAGQVLSGMREMLSPQDKRREMSAMLVWVVLGVVRLVCRDRGLYELLCVRDKEKCFLSSVSSLLHATATGDAGSRWEAARGTTRWLAACLGEAEGRMPWLDNSCRWCTGDMVRSLVVVTHSLVLDYTAIEGRLGKEDKEASEQTKSLNLGMEEKLIPGGRDVKGITANRGERNGGDMEEIDTNGKVIITACKKASDKVEVLSVLKDCVTCLAGMQDKLREGNDLEESNWIRLLEVACSVQRRYIWTIDQLHRILVEEPSLVRRLNNLTMEQKEEEL